MSALRPLFFAESKELLLEFESLLRAEHHATSSASAAANASVLDALFRNIHTIKGSASLVDMPDIVELAHQLETQLAHLKHDKAILTASIRQQLLHASDELSAQINAIEAGATLSYRRQSSVASAQHIATQTWQISLRFSQYCLQQGIDPANVLVFLQERGEVSELRCVPDSLPAPSHFDPQSWYLAWELQYRSALSEDEIRASLVLMGDALRCDMQPILPPSAAIDAAPQIDAPHRIRRGLRIDADRLDHLINIVGELIQSGANVSQQANLSEIESLQIAQRQVDKLLDELRHCALGLRMIPIGDLFDSFPRVGREMAAQLGKSIEFVQVGSHTELDKKVVDQLFDPLLHLIRNAIDHGIEEASERLALGKPAQGQITLSAKHEAGQIEIEVSDDGRGLNHAHILARARARGLVAADAEPSAAELAQLILLPGFSTNESVNLISGRGVGLDVVKRGIEGLRGHLSIHSQAGLGTTFRLQLPLTLAILQVFRLRVGSNEFIVQLNQIQECFGLRDPHADQRAHIEHHGKMLPLIHLARLFDLPIAPATSHRHRRDIAVIADGERRAGLVVEELCGELAVVVKPLDEILRLLPCVAGSATLPNGQVALQLDTAQLIALACAKEAQHWQPPSSETRPSDNEVSNGS